QLIVSADLVDVDEWLAESANLRAEKLDAERMLADGERRGAEVEENLGASGVQVGDRVLVIQSPRDQLLVVPEILADGEAGGDVECVADFDEVFGFVGRARLEIAALVEHVVRRQKRLEVLADDLTVTTDTDGVVDGATDGAGVWRG